MLMLTGMRSAWLWRSTALGMQTFAVMFDDHERQNDIVRQGDRTFLRVLTWVLRYEPEVFMSQLADVLRSAER